MMHWMGDGVYLLPTEAEWEYAARAGTATQRYWGDDERQACRFANVVDNSWDADKSGAAKGVECGDGFYFSAPVGRFEPNGFSLYDMLGNVSEWTCSRYGGYDEDWYKQCADPGERNANLVFRGGSWRSLPVNVRSAQRARFDPGFRSYNLGFRLARALH